MAVSAIGAMARVGAKRKRGEEQPSLTKDSRGAKSIPTPEHLPSDIEDQESLETDGSADEYQAPRQATSAPLTPASPRRRFPSEQKTHHCTYQGCQKSFNRPARLAEHMRSHTNERPFVCPQDGCDKAFLRDTHLNHHVKSAHTGVREYSCQWPGCEKNFLTATRLRRHQAVHEGKEKYRCREHPPCDETFRKHSTLQRHITSVHLQQKPFPCSHIDPATQEKCSQAFETAGKLRAHEGRIHGGLRFWCTECQPRRTSINSADDEGPGSRKGTGFPTYALLQAHLREVHPPTCPSCGESYSTRGELRQHLELHHAENTGGSRPVRPHRCPHPTCGKAFTKKGNLTVHERTVHSTARPFICSPAADLSASRDCAAWDPATDACGQAFKTKAILEEHVRNVHLHLGTRAAKPTYHRGHQGSRQRGPGSSAIDRLTGASYASDPQRPIACLFSPDSPRHLRAFSSPAPGDACHHRFTRDYDLDVHLRSHHGLVPAEIAALKVEREMSIGGRFWIGGEDEDEDEETRSEQEEDFDWALAMDDDEEEGLHVGAEGDQRAPFGFGDEGEGQEAPPREGDGDVLINPALLGVG